MAWWNTLLLFTEMCVHIAQFAFVLPVRSAITQISTGLAPADVAAGKFSYGLHAKP